MTHVLVPVAILEGESVPAGLMKLLAPVDVTILGYHVVPEQTPPDQARLQFEDRATAALEDIAQEFRDAGATADYRLVFTPDRERTVERIAADVGAEAYAISGATGRVERLLVPVAGDVDVEHLVEFVSTLVGQRDILVTLLLAGESLPEEEDLEWSRHELQTRDVAVETKRVPDMDPFGALIEEAPEHDAIVMGEQAPSLRSLIFGGETERVAAGSVGPVLVVRQPTPEE